MVQDLTPLDSLGPNLIFQLCSGLTSPHCTHPSSSLHSQAFPFQIFCSGTSCSRPFCLITLKIIYPSFSFAPHPKPPGMHLTFLQDSKDLGLPPLLGESIIQPHRHTHSPICLSWGGERGQDPSAVHPPHPQLPFYNGAILGLPQEKAPLSVPFRTLWKVPLNLSCQEVACPGATGERV